MFIYTYTYLCMYKSFLTMLDKGFRKNNKQETETGKHKLNEMGAQNMKQKNETNQTKKKSSYSPVVFKHG